MTDKPISYDYASFTLSNGASDYDVASGVANLFSNVPVAKHVVIFFNKEIGCKFNSELMPAITLNIGKNPFQSPDDFLRIKNIYLSNSSGADATVEILLW